MELGDRIRELRKSKGETLKTTSESIDLSVSYLSDIERGRTNPSLQTLESLSKHFGVTVTDLLFGVEFAGVQTEKALPPGLADLLNDKEFSGEIDEAWVELLTKMTLEGKRPQTKLQWLELYLSLKRFLRNRVRTIVSDQTFLSEKLLRERVVELVQDARRPLPENASNTDIEQCFGLEVCEEDLPLDKDGAYIESKSKIVINNKVTSVARRKFTVFHELVHYLIRKDASLYSYLHDAYEDSDIFDKTIEILCNVGAAEFILPRQLVRDLINETGFSLNLVPQLCQKSNVSGPAALIQLVQNASNRCYGVVCEFGLPPTLTYTNQQTFIRSAHVNSLYILYAIWSPSARYLISRFTSIPKDHILMQAYSEGDLIKGTDKIPFRSGTDWEVPVEAIRFRGNVYGIFNVTPSPNQQQLKFF